MNAIRFLYFFIATIVAVAKSSADADDVSLLRLNHHYGRIIFVNPIIQQAQSLLESKSKHIPQGSGSNDEINDECFDDDDDGESSNPLSTYPSPSPSIAMYEEKKLVASGGSDKDNFGSSCSISGELVVIGAPPVFGKGAAFGIHDIEEEGAAYLFHLDGTEIKKLTHGNERDDDAWFGVPVSIDEKVVVATPLTDGSSVLQVFSRNGTYERTIRCDDCHHGIGRAVATLGNLIVTSGVQNSMYQLFILTTEGKFLKSYGQKLRLWLESVAISEQFIVSTSRSYDSDGVTIIYSNTSPDFPKIAEIKQGGTQVAVSNDRIVINDPSANNYDGAVYLYKTDGTLVKTLEIGWRSVDITDDKVFVGGSAGSVSIYSANTGEFLEKVVAPDGEADDWFGVSVCASDSHYVVGATGVDTYTGAAYLFQSSEE